MKLSRFIAENTILLLPQAQDKWQVLSLMAEALAQTQAIKKASLTAEAIKRDIFHREKQLSTGMGDGLAFPHARLAGVKEPAVCLAVLGTPLPYDAQDKQPVSVLSMTLCPEENPTISLKVMAQLARFFSNPEARSKTMLAKSPREILEELTRADLSLDIPITARDIMRPLLFDTAPNAPIREVTHLMARNRLSAIPVTGPEKELLGEVRCDLLFQVGIPEFFTQLKSVSFIAEFDPFEKYFEQESKATAKDMMHNDFCAMPPEATILEIVFALAVKHHPNVYVLRDGKIAGLIDKSAVLDRIVNL